MAESKNFSPTDIDLGLDFNSPENVQMFELLIHSLINDKNIAAIITIYSKMQYTPFGPYLLNIMKNLSIVLIPTANLSDLSKLAALFYSPGREHQDVYKQVVNRINKIISVPVDRGDSRGGRRGGGREIGSSVYI